MSHALPATALPATGLASNTLPLFVGGIPGGMELAIIFLLFLIFAVPVALIILVILKRAGSSSPTDVDGRLDQIESQLEDIQTTLEADEKN